MSSDAHEHIEDEAPSPLFNQTTLKGQSNVDGTHNEASSVPNNNNNTSRPNPPPPARGQSSSSSFVSSSDQFGDRQRRVSYPVQSNTNTFHSGNSPSDLVGQGASDDIWGSGAGRTTRAASDGLVLSNGVTSPAPATISGPSSSLSATTSPPLSTTGLPKRGSDASASDVSEQQERAALFREHERRSLESLAATRLSSSSRDFSSPLPVPASVINGGLGGPNSFFQPQASSSSTNLPLLSPTSQSPPQSASASSASVAGTNTTAATTTTGSENGDARTNASLHLGELDAWMMDEAYIRECCARMGWDSVQHIKLIRGSSPSSGYCFLTFPSAAHAAQALARFNAAPPVLMPRSGRTFKLNWGTGLPGLQPRWTGEYSVFVGDLGRDVGEADLVGLFTPIFPSTKSAKVMCDPSTGLSRGYGFVRFAEEADMQRALLIGQNAGSGLSLHGRTLRISEASGPGQDGSRPLGNGLDRVRTRSRSGEGHGLAGLSIQTAGYGGSSSNQGGGSQSDIISPTAMNGNAAYPDFLSPSYPGAFSPNGPMSPGGSSYGGASKPLSPSLGGLNSMNDRRGAPISSSGAFGAAAMNGPAGPGTHPTDPNNTTVFVGGLPACISEETLKSYFHHFGEITYCKIPAGKGCGFVQFVRRQDAELAIAKMNDFPIHGKSRIRLSWGRSQGDKQVEHVRKLASALGVPFEAVWRMVQGQDNTTIKQIASAVGGGNNNHNNHHNNANQYTRQGLSMGSHASTFASNGPRTDGGAGIGRMDLGAVASAAGLTEAEVMDLVGGRAQQQQQSVTSAGPPLNGPRNDYGSEAFSRSSGLMPGAGSFASNQGFAPAPYNNSNRPDQYHSSSPYPNADLSNDGGMRGTAGQDRFNSFARYGADSQGYAPPHLAHGSNAGGYPSHAGYEYQDRNYSTMSPPHQGSGLEDSFSNLGFGVPAASSLAPRSFFPGSASTPASDAPRSMNGGSAAQGSNVDEQLNTSSWSSTWHGVHA